MCFACMHVVCRLYRLAHDVYSTQDYMLLIMKLFRPNTPDLALEACFGHWVRFWGPASAPGVAGACFLSNL